MSKGRLKISQRRCEQGSRLSGRPEEGSPGRSGAARQSRRRPTAAAGAEKHRCEILLQFTFSLVPTWGLGAHPPQAGGPENTLGLWPARSHQYKRKEAKGPTLTPLTWKQPLFRLASLLSLVS